MSNNVISLNALKDLREAKQSDPAYEARIARMEKLELLEEMIRFQEERSRTGELSLSLMVRGKVLFRALETHAETHELQLLASSYRKHLEYEMEDFIQRGSKRAKAKEEAAVKH